MDRRQGLDCQPCPFSDPGQGNSSDPRYQDPPNINDAQCFAKIKKAFLLSVDAQSLDENNELTADGCRYLEEHDEGGNLFFALYWMDMHYCGLGVVGSGQEPNFNSIRNSCSSYINLTDPGWPTVAYQCGLCPSTAVAATKIEASTAAQPTISLTRLAGLSSTSSSSGPATTASSISLNSPSSTSPAAAIATGDPSNTNNFPSGTSTPASTDAVSTTPNKDLSGEQIAAITIGSVGAIVLAVLLLLSVLRRRRKREEELYARDLSKSLNSRGKSDFTTPPADSYQPLISPSHSMTSNRPPLTPPLRLRERRLLPSLLRPLSQSLLFGPPSENRHDSSSSLYSTSAKQLEHDAASAPAVATGPYGKGRASFPSASVCAPTANKLQPREERIQAYFHPKKAAGSAPPTTISPELGTSPPTVRLRSPPPVSFAFLSRGESAVGSPTSTNQGSPPRIQGHRRGGTASSPPSRGSGFSGFISAAFASPSTSGSGEAYLGPNGNAKATRVISLNPFATTSPPPPPPPPPSSSPMRPRRPHDEPLEIPDLVAPDYPVIPAKSTSRPPSQPLSPSPSPGPRASSSMGTIGVARGSGGIDQVMNHAHGSISLQNLAEQHLKSQRAASGDSWGSWEETAAAGKMFGVSFPPPPGREGRMTP